MSTDLWSLDALVEAYKQYQRRTRGLRERTLEGYEGLVRPFVRAALGEDPVDPRRLGSADLIGYLAAVGTRVSPTTMRTVRAAPRSFCRYLRVEGLCQEQLEQALPVVARWRPRTPEAAASRKVGQTG